MLGGATSCGAWIGSNCEEEMLVRLHQLGVKTERIRMDNSEIVFVTIFFSNLEPEWIVCGYEYGIGVYRL
jgi:hypothetical protein